MGFKIIKITHLFYPFMKFPKDIPVIFISLKLRQGANSSASNARAMAAAAMSALTSAYRLEGCLEYQ